MVPGEDRRRWKRYPVDWPFVITGVSEAGEAFESEGTLCNLSARGALGCCHVLPREGARLEVYISIPFGTGKRIKYSARVVRVETGPDTAVALMFDTARPVFNEEAPNSASNSFNQTKGRAFA